jgi:ABC-type sulfate/molybdate transport systems ATPase subunit
MTVEQHLAYVAGKVCSRRSVPGEVDRLLDLGKLAGKRRSYPNEMSGGELQRLALLRAVAVSPSLLLLDEPMSSLDRKARGELAVEIKSLRAASDFTTLHVTHDWRDVRGLADRVIELEEGTFRRQSPAVNYFQEKIAEETVL